MTRTITTLPTTELPVAEGNFDRTRSVIDRVIIHTMVGTWQGAGNRFNTYGQQASAHYGVKLDGGLIHWLEETFTAYHAGDYSVNQRSIGIEHEDGGDYNGIRSDALYTASASLVHDICTFYNIPLDRAHILKHNEVSDTPTGCPDALDIDRIIQEAKALTESQVTLPQKELDQIRHDRDQHYNDLQTALAQITQLTVKHTNLKHEYDDYVVAHPITHVYTVPVSSTTTQVTESASENTHSITSPIDATNNTPTGLGYWISRIFHSIFSRQRGS